MRIVVYVGQPGAKSPMISAFMNVDAEPDPEGGQEVIEAIGGALEEYGRKLKANAGCVPGPGEYMLDESGNLIDPEEN